MTGIKQRNWRQLLKSLELAHLLVDTVVDKKGSDIVLLDIRDHAVFADYFLIVNGDNERQLRALTDNITQDAKATASVSSVEVEGQPSSGWVLVDFGDLVVHLFSPEQRDYYRLEELWGDAHVVMHIQ